jgi:hypothetical protein
VAFGREVLGRIYEEGLDIPAYSTFDPQKFAKYFPKGLTSMFFGGIIVRLARKKKVTSKQQSLLEKYLGMGMMMVVAVLCVCASWFVPLS